MRADENWLEIRIFYCIFYKPQNIRTNKLKLMSNNVELMFTHQSNIEIPKWISYAYSMYIFLRWAYKHKKIKIRDRIKKSKRKSF